MTLNKHSIPSLPSLWPGVVVPDRVLSMGQIELFGYLNCMQTNDFGEIELFEIELFDRLTI